MAKNETYKRFAKTSTSNIIVFAFIFLYRFAYKIYQYLSNLNLRDAYRLQKFYNKYSGKRCFIIGNGPSLNDTNLRYLKDEFTFGLNRIYLNFKRMGYETSFLVSVNELLISQCAKDFDKLHIPKFISVKAKKEVKHTDTTYFIRTHGTPSFSHDITEGVYEGSTVAYVAMQIAYYMGFSEVILVGVDHKFVTRGKPHSTIFQSGNDPNHFSGNYFRGMNWQLPDLETSELAYMLAKHEFEASGRTISDATVNGKLKVFRKVKYEDLFSKSK